MSSHIAGYDCVQIELSRGYDYNSFHEDIKKLYELAGVQNKHTTFLFTDTQVSSWFEQLIKSDCLLFNANSAIFSYRISWQEQVSFQWDDDDKVYFVLEQHAELDFYSASSLKQQSTDKHVAPLGHIILIQSQQVFSLSP